MKETKKRRYIVSTIMYGMILIFIQLPWVVLKGKNYSIYAAYFRIKAKGIKALSEMAASVWDGNLTIIRIQLILLIVFQIVIVLHIVTQWLHKEYYLNIAALVVLGLYIVVNESGFGMLADNSTKTILIPAIIMIFVMAEVLIRKMLDVWKDAKESAEIFAEKEREEKEEAAQPPKEVGFISVSVGKGMTEIFKELGVDYLIEGGQTMNPSTEDMLNAIAKVNAKTIYIFPNNKNIVLAANQARDLTEDKEIVVVPTKTIPQGITAMISYVPEKNSAENTEAMLQAIEHVKTGQITYAVRDTRIDDKEIHEGDMMGIGDHGILAVGKDRMEVAKETVAQMVDDESEVISIYYGADTEEAEAEELATALEEAYPECDVELNAGGQPIYYYVISVE